MDKKELRERMGTNHHYHPEMNPHAEPKPHWWNKKISQPLQIGRQRSSTLEESSSSPVGSPSTASPASKPHWSFDFSKQRARSYSADEHKDSVLT